MNDAGFSYSAGGGLRVRAVLGRCWSDYLFAAPLALGEVPIAQPAPSPTLRKREKLL